MPQTRSDFSRRTATIEVDVIPALCDTVGGSVRCACVDGAHIVACTWHREGRPTRVTHPHNDETVAIDMAPGEYTIRIVDDIHRTHLKCVRVPLLSLPVVESYRVQNASSDWSRDGVVEAVVRNAPHECRYLWTSGVITSDAVLRDAPPGCYTASLLHAHDDDVVITHVHLSQVAHVRSA